MEITPTWLRAIRMHLFFSVPEAAEIIGGVGERYWRYMESGEKPIKEDIVEKFRSLCEWRNAEIHLRTSAVYEMPDEQELVLVWHSTLDDWISMPDRDPELWRPECSIAAELCAVFDATLIEFDLSAYKTWLKNSKDSEEMRKKWAAEYQNSAIDL